MSIKAVVFDAYGTLYDIQSVAAVTEQAFPGYGEIITQIWRIKQLEYTWLRSLMRRYEDFSVVTRDFARLHAQSARAASTTARRSNASWTSICISISIRMPRQPLLAMQGRKLAILSNGSTGMLDALVANSGLDRVLDATISIDSQRIFKPAPEAYGLIETRLGVPPAEVLFSLLEPVGRLRRQGLRPQRRLDRAGDARSDGAGLRQE